MVLRQTEDLLLSLVAIKEEVVDRDRETSSNSHSSIEQVLTQMSAREDNKHSCGSNRDVHNSNNLASSRITTLEICNHQFARQEHHDSSRHLQVMYSQTVLSFKTLFQQMTLSSLTESRVQVSTTFMSTWRTYQISNISHLRSPMSDQYFFLPNH